MASSRAQSLSWLGLKAHSGSVDRRMSKDPAPVGDVCISSLKSVLWFTISVSSGCPTVFAHSFLTNGLYQDRLPKGKANTGLTNLFFYFFKVQWLSKEVPFFYHVAIL